MQRMGGGGNDPSCGCDMQAGWPSASELPRGGVQGGGNWNFNEFNLALTKNGKTRHLKGKWNTNNGMNVSQNTMNSNLKLNTPKNNNMNKNNTKNNKKNNNNTKNNKKNNKNNNNKRNNTTRPTTSAPPDLEKLMFEGKVYETDRKTGNTYENGEYVGKYIRPNSGKPYLDRATPRTPNYKPETPNYAPPDAEEDSNEGSSEEYDTEENNTNVKTPKSLSMNGGRRTRRRRTQKHGKRCPCLLCSFRKLKMAGGGR